MSTSCEVIHHWFHERPRLRTPFEKQQVPRNGIYVLFEHAEHAHGGDRIVRVGPHTGANQLRTRLHQHFFQENKDRSIFRKNIGRSLLARESDPFLEFWNVDLTTRKARERYAEQIDSDKQQTVEGAVSEYMRQSFSFVVFEVHDRGDRLRLESRLVSTVSLCRECRPSDEWLGLVSPKERIRESGLWQVNELYKDPLSDVELQEIQRFLH